MYHVDETYYHPNYRVKSLNRVRWGEKYFLPYELKIAKEKKYDYVFLSNEPLNRRTLLIDTVKYLNLHNLTNTKWIMHPEICNTCRVYNNEGKYIGIIHSDDWYEPDAVQIAVDAFNTHKCDIVHGAMYYHRPNLLIRRSVPIKNIWQKMPFNHPTVFIWGKLVYYSR